MKFGNLQTRLFNLHRLNDRVYFPPRNNLFNNIIDISQLSPGSTAFDISSSKTYMLNNKKQWIEVQINSYDGGTPGAPGGDIIYDGGGV